jgi:hypothetical protein
MLIDGEACSDALCDGCEAKEIARVPCCVACFDAKNKVRETNEKHRK